MTAFQTSGEPSLETLIKLVRSRSTPSADRLRALRSLLSLEATQGKVLLLEIANDESESDETLLAVGEWLARLACAGVVSEFDTRDMTERASDAFFDIR